MSESQEQQGATTPADNGAVRATVLQFAARALKPKAEQYLTDAERAALRRVIALLPRLEEMDRQLARVESACPTFRREAGK